MNTPIPAPTESEARASLAEIARIAECTRKTIAYGSGAPLMILWGLIWLAGFTTSQFNFGSFHFTRLVWTVLDLIGFAATIFIAYYRKAPVKGSHGGRIGLSWLILMFFACVWINLLAGRRHGAEVAFNEEAFFRQTAAFLCTVAMFAYAIMGLWLGRFYLWLGLAVTVITL